MSRKITVDAVMRKAYRKRDVETFVWGLLKNFEEELKTGVLPKSRTFSGRDIVGLVNTLVNLERVRKESRDEKVDETVDQWGGPDSAWTAAADAEDDADGDDHASVN